MARARPRSTAPDRRRPHAGDVEVYLAALDHPMKDGILALRRAILASGPPLTEHIKWNAPSFCHGGDDRVTFRLPPRGGLQLILHRGAKAKDTRGFSFADPTGLVTWAAVDRGVVTLRDAAEVKAHTAAIARLVAAWVAATT